MVYLTELDPAKEEQISFLGTKWPAQADKNVMGAPLRVGGVTFAKGIGVHTQSTLIYELDGSFDTLALRVGLDDSAAPQGEARASIILYGKTLWQSQTLKPGELSPQLDLAHRRRQTRSNFTPTPPATSMSWAASIGSTSL